jgi:hypothetical protein
MEVLMSSSPVHSLRTLQSAIKQATGVEVPLLDLSKVLLDHMASSTLRFSREAIRIYHDRLRNWRTADQIVMRRFHAIRRDRRATLADIEALYEVYSAEAQALGFEPMGLGTFRLRAYQIPIPKQRPSPLLLNR